MVVYNFKKIQAVPSSKDFIDIVLSKTQRKTPTVVHKGYAISRIRSFYMRKVKFTQQTYHDKLSQILSDFPILDDIHPFYADLINVLYDKDHYKLALGQLSTARHLIDNIAKDYLRLLKYGDSLYRCKQLKRAAMGRMCTLMKKQGPSLAYLEQVRQHLARLPSIDPNARTLIVCGYPNVGKSSFMNRVTRANVDVQPYAFTTKSLFVGHTDYKYLRWQVIDTPGILDHPLEDRNTIEMQSITALAHLRAAILYIVDPSEQCGYSLKQQVDLFNSIKPLFTNKPLIIIANKMDVIEIEELAPESQKLLKDLETAEGVELLRMSTFTEEGVSKVKEVACDKLLEQRVEVKLKTKQVGNILNRIHLAVPAPRDQKERTPFIPTTVFESRAQKSSQMETEKSEEGIIFSRIPNEDELEEVDPTVFGPDLREKYLLEDPDWRFDVRPEILNGKNVYDFIDPEIDRLLEELEREEDEREREMEDQMEDDEFELTEEQESILEEARDKKKMIVQQHRLSKSTAKNKPVIPRKHEDKDVDEFQKHLQEMGIDGQKAAERVRERSRSRSESRVGRKRLRSEGPSGEGEDKRQKDSSRSRSRSKSAVPLPGEGYKDVKQKVAADKLAKKSSKVRNKEARKGESDRKILNMKPKHLYSGKRGGGSTDRR
eukprot:TRINITY_DN10783_c0_g1_i1.p1 TRINITY_DN10783_c0_g1~~TRINITY_DN10783_c0_g1_i1.p1  ORF type:complete len:659 (+),score=170.10 TRINITY_DN10783_c0_g1_i1:74-2050(+)